MVQFSDAVSSRRRRGFKPIPGIRTSPTRQQTAHGGGLEITVDATELEHMLTDMEEELVKAIADSVQELLYEVREKTQFHMFKFAGQGQAPKAPKDVAFALRPKDIRIDMARLEVTASFEVDGTKQGVFTTADDDGNRFNLAMALEEGVDPQMVYFQGYTGQGGARIFGRQYGKRGSNTGWTMRNPGRYYHKGFPQIGYMAFAQDYFTERLEEVLTRMIEKRYGPGAFYNR